MTGNLALSEDVVQEVYLRLYHQLHQGKLIERPEGWMFCVLRREIRNQQQKRLKEKAFDQNIEAIQSTKDNPLIGPGFLEAALDRAHLTRLLQVLTAREREVIVLRLADLKYREIAEILGISTSSVNTLLARAIRKLRKAVKKTSLRFSGEDRFIEMRFTETRTPSD